MILCSSSEVTASRLTHVDFFFFIFSSRNWEDPEGGGALIWEVADMTSRTRWADESFDVVLDKAMLDALLTGRLTGASAAVLSASSAGAGADAGPDADADAGADGAASAAAASDRPAEAPATNGTACSHDASVAACVAQAHDEPSREGTSAHESEQVAAAGASAWSDTSDGDLSAARAYLAEVHRLLAPGVLPECMCPPLLSMALHRQSSLHAAQWHTVAEVFKLQRPTTSMLCNLVGAWI